MGVFIVKTPLPAAIGRVTLSKRPLDRTKESVFTCSYNSAVELQGISKCSLFQLSSPLRYSFHRDVLQLLSLLPIQDLWFS